MSCARERVYWSKRDKERDWEKRWPCYSSREREIEAQWLGHHCCALGNGGSYGSRPSSLSPTRDHLHHPTPATPPARHYLHHLKRPICLFNCDPPDGRRPPLQICTAPSTQPRALLFLARPLSLLNASLSAQSLSDDLISFYRLCLVSSEWWRTEMELIEERIGAWAFCILDPCLTEREREREKKNE
jgi:hypothetical protein